MNNPFALKGRYMGETVLTIANGPSLNDVPLSFLRKYTSFGCNRISVLYDRTGFAPTIYACAGYNHFDSPEKRDTMKPMLRCPDVKIAFLNRLMAHLMADDPVIAAKTYTILGPSLYNLPMTQWNAWSPLPIHVIGLSFSQVFPNLQLAYYMGFKIALLVGLDHRYDMTSEQKHFYKDSDVPMFDVAPGVHKVDDWLLGATHGFRMARQIWEEDGRRIINLTPNSGTDAFEFGKLEDWI